MSDESRSLLSNDSISYGSTGNPQRPINDTQSEEQVDNMRSSLSFIQKIGFGLGHVYNDLCAGVWFSYTLLFMQAALGMPSAMAGALVMLGQVGDALVTPIVGFLADRYGTKRKWHLAGTGIVFLSFPMIFSLCPMCQIWPLWWQPIYFTFYILLFQLGWAIVQITHLAMIPEMSHTQKDRSDLTAMRYSASVCSNVIVYFVTWAVLHSRNKQDNNIGPSDAYRFRDISLILTLIGVSMTVCFNFSLSLSGYDHRRHRALNPIRRRSDSINSKQNDGETIKDNRKLISSSSSSVLAAPKPRKNFFKSPLLYINTFLYVFSRLFMTTSLVYMPLWLDERSWNQIPVTTTPIHPINYPPTSINVFLTNDSDKSVEHIATVPLVSFLASFIASFALKFSTRIVGHQLAYLIGSVASISGCTWIALSATPNATSFQLYAVAALIGAGSSITMISSLCITADMIGRHADQSGFIYSAVTFADKLITGIVVVVIESLKCKQRKDCPEYYRNVLAYGCGLSAILGLFTLFILQLNRWKNRLRPQHTSQAVVHS